MIRAAMISVAGAALALPIASLGSLAMPLGLGRRAEPDLGVSLDVFVLCAGAAAIVFVMTARAIVPAVRSAARAARPLGRAASAPDETGRIAAAVAQIGLPPAVVAGVRMAFNAGRGERAVPLRTTVVGVIAALAALLSALGFGASIDRLVATPRLYGWSWDATVGNPNNGDPGNPNVTEELSGDMERRLLADPDVGSFSGAAFTPARIDGRTIAIAALESAHGTVFPPLHSGRQPEGRAEIALSAAAARRLGARLGDRVTVSLGGAVKPFRVVGSSVTAGLAGVLQLPAEAGIMSLEAARDLGFEIPPYVFFVRYRPGIDPRAAFARLRKTFGPVVLLPLAPADVHNMGQIRWMPYALSALLVLLGAATLVNVLVTSVRRRRRDLAVLKTLGFVRRQISATVAWQATTLAVVCLVVATPIGIAAGRWAWQITARRLGLVPAPVVPLGAALATIAGAAVLANLVAALPGWFAGRISAGEALRAE